MSCSHLDNIVFGKVPCSPHNFECVLQFSWGLQLYSYGAHCTVASVFVGLMEVKEMGLAVYLRSY